MIDDNLKPWLIEVNASPSISADTINDYDLKFGLLEDVYTVLDVEQKLGGQGADGKSLEPQVGGFDLIYHGDKVRTDKQATYSSQLGCFDPADRVRNLKALFAKHGAAYKPPEVKF